MIAGVLGLLAPVLVGGYTLDLVMQLIILILVVTSWIFIAGYFGMFSFAHAALYGIGAYAAVLLAGEMGIHPIIAVLLGGVVAGILSIRLRSRCFACQGHTSEWSHWRSRRSSTGW